MATATWIPVRSAEYPAVIAVLAAAGAGLIFLMFRRTEKRLAQRMSRCEHRATRNEHRAANLAGEISALRDDSEYRLDMQRIWAMDPEFAHLLFQQPE